MERRLAAILVSDVVGYSRLMSGDEAGTLARLKAARAEVIDPAIVAHHGRVIKLMGDGALVEFASVVDAVQCAAVIQRAMAARETEIIKLRIGVNLGDIMVDGGDIYGDGVNVAARLEAEAEPGGICVSGTAFDHALHKVDVGFESLGELHLKNIADPVRAYRVVLDPAAAGKVVDTPRRAVPRYVFAGVAGLLIMAVVAATYFWQPAAVLARPSIAVLPFANTSADPEEGYFADGITEDLITDLAMLSGLDVISRNSVFKFKGEAVEPGEAARKLGVRYVVEGSVRRMGEQIRVNAQLIDTQTGKASWAEKYERKAADVFAVEDDVISGIVAALGIEPTQAETSRLTRLPTASLEAYDLFLRGEQAARSGSRPGLRKAMDFYEKAVALDPAFADAYAADARTAVFAWRLVYDDVLPSPVAKKRAYEMAGRALELNPRASQPYATLAILQCVDGQYNQAIASARKAVALGPSNVDAQIALGFALSAAGQHADGAAAISAAQRIDPNLSTTDRIVAGLVLLLNGDFAGSISTLEGARAGADRDDILILLAAAYAGADRMEEARAAVSDALRIYLVGNIESYILSISYLRRKEDQETVRGLLRRAGYPKWPYNFQADERDKLRGEEVSRLILGRDLRGKTGGGSPAIMQVGRDGAMVFRSNTLLYSGRAFVKNDDLCTQSESVALNRPHCGPVYRRSMAGDGLAYTFVNATTVFHFSPRE